MRHVALVTGGARGIGAALVARLCADYEVVYTHLTTPPSKALMGTPYEVDLTGDGAIGALVDQVIGQFGRLDLVVNNAGLASATPPEQGELAPARAMFEVNLFAPIALLAASLPHLKPGASLINISSQNARQPAMSAPIYSASKAALECWTRAMAKNLGPTGIRVNAVAPGAVETPEKPRPADLRAIFEKDTALGELATPEDIAQAVAFLASPAAKSITGEVLTVSGGYRL